MSLTHLSLFSGIGGLDLAAEMAGIKTVGQCEWADFQTKVLEKHWPDVPRWRDIRTLTADSFYERTGLRTVDIVSGGFPWVIGENVPGIVNLALDTVLSDLENEGYSTQPFIIPACGVDAPHRRDRVCIVAHSGSRSCVRWYRCDEHHEAVSGQGNDNAGGIPQFCSRERRQDESRTAGVVDGLSEGIHATDTDTEGKRLQGISPEQICRGGYYRHQLMELLEATPLGLIGRTNPAWVEWLMGYPIGWTELDHSETQ